MSARIADIAPFAAPPILAWSALDVDARAAALRRPTREFDADVQARVARIFDQVAADGDGALRALTRRFDGAQVADFAVSEAEFALAESQVPADLRAAMADAKARLDTWHRAGMAAEFSVATAPGVVCGRVLRGIDRVGLYVPAGSAPLPSTALMLCVPAALAGVGESVLCTPPRADGSADPAVLVAARLCGVSRVFKLGGAQAIAAMALGTDSVPRCDNCSAPATPTSPQAKQQASGRPGGPAIDLPAGPSEVLVVADAGASPVRVAADLLSQAEHGADSQVLLLSDSQILLQEVARELARQLPTLPRASTAAASLAHARLVLTATLDEAIAISNRYAPEHLILATAAPDALLRDVRRAGSVFLGDDAAEALGDYCSGTNHVLPTDGAARAWSGLGVASFQTAISVQSVDRRASRRSGPARSPWRARKASRRMRARSRSGWRRRMSALDLVRPDLRDFAGYASARRTLARGAIWLNANESPTASPVDASGGLNRYPEPQPAELRAALAALYGVPADALMVTRGSDEGIDLLVRALCRAGIDGVAIATPCFGMYAVSARIQGAPLVDVPLRDDDGEWSLDADAIVGAVEQGVRLVFLCSPGNPTGQVVPMPTVAALAERLRGRAVLVVDEAYAEYSAAGTAMSLLPAHPGLVVLRTLSKAHALAGARIGALVGAPELVALLRNLSAPYPIAAPSAALALAALAPAQRAATRTRCAATIVARDRLAPRLAALAGVRRVYRSDANFLLVRFDDAQAAFDALLAAGVVVRDMRAMRGLDDALRITIGSADENAAVLVALGGAA
jgi:histidinol dehydrogenase